VYGGEAEYEGERISKDKGSRFVMLCWSLTKYMRRKRRRNEGNGDNSVGGQDTELLVVSLTFSLSWMSSVSRETSE
jgi:hypothetical protein